MLDFGALPGFRDAKGQIFSKEMQIFFMEKIEKKKLWGNLFALHNWSQVGSSSAPTEKKPKKGIPESLRLENPSSPRIQCSPKCHIHTVLKSTSQEGLFHFLFHPLGILGLFSPPSLPLAAEHGWFGSSGRIFGSLLALGRSLGHRGTLHPERPREQGRSQPFNPPKMRNKWTFPSTTALAQGDGAIPGRAQVGRRNLAGSGRPGHPICQGRCQDPSHPPPPHLSFLFLFFFYSIFF